MSGGRLRVYLATSNPHKLEEARVILSEYPVEVEAAGAPKLEVQADSLEEVALYAAAHAATLGAPQPLLVEDAGLFIEALNGFPGPYSAYVYKTLGLKGILKLMEGVPSRHAVFRAAVAVAYRGTVKVFTGEVRGVIVEEPRGSSGFGFDPIFKPEGWDRTFAEAGLEEKCRVSHRAVALRRAIEWLLRVA